MAGIQRLFENTKDRKGNVLQVDMVAVKKAEDWVKAFVRTEVGCFCFSDLDTAKVFVGEGDKAVGILTVL